METGTTIPTKGQTESGDDSTRDLRMEESVEDLFSILTTGTSSDWGD